eukprot:696346-Hanusia_phi.AAC.2
MARSRCRCARPRAAKAAEKSAAVRGGRGPESEGDQPEGLRAEVLARDRDCSVCQEEFEPSVSQPTRQRPGR